MQTDSATRKVPPLAWAVTFAGTAVNLCLGILYAWSVWKQRLVGTPAHPAGTPMTGLDAGWTYLTDAQATWAYSIAGMVFALIMIPGGRIQDRFGPRVGATLGGLCLAAGCLLAGVMKSYTGLILGIGLLGGIGMGLGYAAATPAAVRWFGPHRRGLVVGLVVAGYGAAAIYIAPVARSLIEGYGLSASFMTLGTAFALVVIVAGSLLRFPAPGYVPPARDDAGPVATTPPSTVVNWAPGEMVRTWQFYAMLLLFIGSAQAGLLVIGNAASILRTTAESVPFFATNAWLVASFGGFVNAAGRVGTGMYSDRIGRNRAYAINAVMGLAALLLLPMIIASGQLTLMFLAVGVSYWQYGGVMALMPALTADYFGPRNLGTNYGLVFTGWGIAFLVPLLAGYIKDATGSLDAPFYLSAALLAGALALSRLLRAPERSEAEVALTSS